MDGIGDVGGVVGRLVVGDEISDVLCVDMSRAVGDRAAHGAIAWYHGVDHGVAPVITEEYIVVDDEEVVCVFG